MSIPEYQQWHVSQLQALGLPAEFAQSFVAFTRDVDNSSQTVTDADERSINNANRLDVVESELSAHVGASSAHDAAGDIVGTENAPSLSQRGSVLLGSAVADAPSSNVSVTSPALQAAPATYSQAHEQTNVALTNEIRGDVGQLAVDLNEVVDQLNALLLSLRESGVLNT